MPTFSTSNWLIRDRILVGEYPGIPNQALHSKNISILAKTTDIFINLLEEFEIDDLDLPDYEQDMLKENPATEFVKFAIPGSFL